jgi:hypothetical protein
MDSKYDILADHLRRQSASSLTMSFDEIDRLIKEGLPASARNRKGLPATARKQRQWWDNDRSPDSRHVQSKYGWLAAGWEVDSVDLNRQSVTFRK